MIKNVILDIGNVLVDFCWAKHFREDLHVPEEYFERVADATVRSKEWSEIDRGVLSDDEVLDLLIKNDPELSEWISLVHNSYKGMIKEFPYSKGWIIDLKKRGYKVYALSNMSYRALRDCADEFGYLDLLDGYVMSCAVKLIKPDRAIYEKICEIYNLKPEECVFFDDTVKNITAAKEFGMEAIQFTSLKEAVAEFEKLDTIEKHPEVKTYTKGQRIMATVGAALIVLMYLLALVLSLLKSDLGKTMFRLAFGCTIIIPVVIWILIWFTGLVKNKHTIASFDLFKNMK